MRSIPSVKWFFFLLIVSVLSGCVYRRFTVPPLGSTVSEGVIVSGEHREDQLFLYFTSGISAATESGAINEVPWGEGALIYLAPGEHRFEIWHNYFGQRANRATVCFVIKPSQILHVKYETSLWMFEEGKVTLVDLKENTNVSKSNCPGPEDTDKK